MPAASPAATVGNLGQLEVAARQVRRERLAIVPVDRPADQDPVPAGRPAGHQGGLGGGRGAVVVGGRHDVQSDQLGQQRLVLVDALEGALTDLGLVRRVRRVPLSAEQDLVDGGRLVVAIGAGPEEARQVRPIAAGQGLEIGRQVQLRLAVRQGEPVGPEDPPECRRTARRPRQTPIASSIWLRSARVWGP